MQIWGWRLRPGASGASAPRGHGSSPQTNLGRPVCLRVTRRCQAALVRIALLSSWAGMTVGHKRLRSGQPCPVWINHSPCSRLPPRAEPRMPLLISSPTSDPPELPPGPLPAENVTKKNPGMSEAHRRRGAQPAFSKRSDNCSFCKIPLLGHFSACMLQAHSAETICCKLCPPEPNM